MPSVILISMRSYKKREREYAPVSDYNNNHFSLAFVLDQLTIPTVRALNR